MDDILSLDSSGLIKQQSAPGTPKSIHQHLCERSRKELDFVKNTKISASHHHDGLLLHEKHPID